VNSARTGRGVKARPRRIFANLSTMASMIDLSNDRSDNNEDDIFADLPSSLVASSSRETYLSEKRTVYRGESDGSMATMRGFPSDEIFADLSEESTQQSPVKMPRHEYHYKPSSKDVDLMPLLRGAAPAAGSLRHMEVPMLTKGGMPLLQEKVSQESISSSTTTTTTTTKLVQKPSGSTEWTLRRLAPSDIKQIPLYSTPFLLHGRERIYLDAIPSDIYLSIVESLSALDIFHKFDAKKWRFECLVHENESKVEFGIVVRRQRKGDASEVTLPSSSTSVIEMFKMRSSTKVWDVIRTVQYEVENRLVRADCVVDGGSKKPKISMQPLPLPPQEKISQQLSKGPSEEELRRLLKMFSDKAMPLVNKVELIVFMHDVARKGDQFQTQLANLGLCEILCKIFTTSCNEDMLWQSLNFVLTMCNHKDTAEAFAQQHALLSCLRSILSRFPLKTLSLASLDLHRQLALVIACACKTSASAREQLLADNASGLIEQLQKSESESVRSAANKALMRIAP